MNIIMIVSDTLRKDHIGCYGNRKIITPFLDQFARECIMFENAYAASFPTMPTRADHFTGKYTFTYLGWNPLTSEDTVLAEIMAANGFTTIAAVDTPFHIRNGYGYDRGFKDFAFISGQDITLDGPRIVSGWRTEEDRFCARTIIEAEKLLEFYHKEKFFLYIDLWDPHEPWDAPPYYTGLYRPDYTGEDHKIPLYNDWEKYGVSPDDVELIHDCYCGEVTMVDRWVGRLLDKVKKTGIWDDTAIIFTSDHGFCFGEHGLVGKGRSNVYLDIPDKCFDYLYDPEVIKELFRKVDTHWQWSPLYEEIARIPLLVYLPGQEPRPNDSLISAVDIMPTILDLADIDAPEFVQGKSFVPVISGKSASIRDFTVTSYPLYNVGDISRIVDGKKKYVRDNLPITITDNKWSMYYTDNKKPVELYDLKKDPGQLNDVSKENPEVVKDLHEKFLKLLHDTGTEEKFIKTRNELAY